MSTTFTAAKLKAVDDVVLPIIDEYLGLNSPLKILEKISPRPKIPVLRQKKRKTESAENLISSPFKKRLEEHGYNVKEKQQAVILRKEKAALNKVIKQKMKSINWKTKKVKKPEKQKAEKPNGIKKQMKRKKDMVSASEYFITDTTHHMLFTY